MSDLTRWVSVGLTAGILIIGLVVVGAGASVAEATWYAERLAEMGIRQAPTEQEPPTAPAEPQAPQSPAAAAVEETGSTPLVTYLRWRQRYFAQQATPDTSSGPTPPETTGVAPEPPAAEPESSPRLTGAWNTQERQLLTLVNARRQTPYQTDARLQAAAQARVKALLEYYLRHKNIPMDHYIPGQGFPTAVVREYGVQYRSGVGENIGAHRDIHRSNAALWASSGHRRNLEDESPWTHIGIGVRDIPGVPGVVVVQLFVRK